MTPAGFELFAPCPRGLEAALADELGQLGASERRMVAGGVLFTGDRQVAYRANLWSRLASRVLRRIGARRYRNDDDLYRLAAGIEWEQCFDARHTLRVDVAATRSPLRSLNFATLRIKDGIVDRLRDRTGERPSIDTRAPDARVFAYLEDRLATLYLDLSGEPLFKRGWRSGAHDKGEAPLKENLAAGLLSLAGWVPPMPLYDPFCGSGTILIEAAQRAFDIAPGLSRAFGLEKLLDHDRALWASLRTEATQRAQATRRTVAPPAVTAAGARAGVRPQSGLLLAGSDVDPRAIEQVRRNAGRAGLAEHAIALRVIDAAVARPPSDQPGFIVTNPPYGERIGAEEAPFTAHAAGVDAASHQRIMRDFGVTLRTHFSGWQAWLLSSDRELPGQLGMKERRRTPLYNGAIECRLYGFEIFARTRPASVNGNDAARPAPPRPGMTSRQ
ncbi:MAG: class I SAM-dependent RNA methyltransferase [Burkholderiaceae bacterium]|nr:class I SAM-dependent RNA methyltransferase [Burkholderiaceae bacterium]